MSGTSWSLDRTIEMWVAAVATLRLLNVAARAAKEVVLQDCYVNSLTEVHCVGVGASIIVALGVVTDARFSWNVLELA